MKRAWVAIKAVVGVIVVLPLVVVSVSAFAVILALVILFAPSGEEFRRDIREEISKLFKRRKEVDAT